MPTQARALNEAEIGTRLVRDLPRWRYENGTIRRIYRTHDWRAAMMVAGAIGHLAEAAWHHPDLLIGFGSVEVRLSTHDASGVTSKDFDLAAKIEEVITWRPGNEDGAPAGSPSEHPYVRRD